nr:hypothetical protein Iba_chr02fCG13230 [Ipomoea batatas]
MGAAAARSGGGRRGGCVESATSSSAGAEAEAAPGSSFVVGKGGGGDRREDAESSHGRQALWSAGAEVEIGQQLYCWNSTSRLSSSSRKKEERSYLLSWGSDRMAEN